MAKSLSIKEFFGLMTGVNEPQPGHAQNFVNLRASRLKGRLVLEDGMASVFTTPGSYSTVATVNTRRIKQFYVPDHGGKAVTAALCSYNQFISINTGLSYLSAVGLFVRPYWSGSAWTDSWMNLTQFYKVRSNGYAGQRLSLQSFTGAHSSIIDSNALAGYIICRTDFSADNNFLLVVASSYNSGSPYLDVQAGVDLANFPEFSTAGNDFYVCRYPLRESFMTTYAATRLWDQLDELRLTTGTGGDRYMTGFRTKGFSVTGIGSIDRFIFERADLEIPDALMAAPTATRSIEATDPLPEGSYEVALSVEYDDGQQSSLIEQPAVTVTDTIEYEAISGLNAPALGPWMKGVAYDRKVIQVVGANTVNIHNLEDGSTTSVSTSIPSGYSSMGQIEGLQVVGTALQIVYSATAGTTRYLWVLSYDLENMQSIGTELYSANDVSGYTVPVFRGDIVGDVGGYRVGVIRVGSSRYAVAFAGAQAGANGSALTYMPESAYSLPMSGASMGSGKAVYPATNYGVTNGAGIIVLDVSGVAAGGSITTTVHNDAGGTIFSAAAVSTMPVACAAVPTQSYIFTARYDGNIYRSSYATPGTFSLWKSSAFTSGTMFRMFALGEYLVVVAAGTVVVYNMAGTAVLTRTVVAYPYFLDAFPTSSGEFVVVRYDGQADRYVVFGDGALTSDGNRAIDLNLHVSPTLISRRGKNVNVWLRKDGEGDYALVKKVDLTSDAFEATTVWNATLKHQHAVLDTPVSIKGEDWSDNWGDAITYIGRDVADDGALDAAGVVVGGNVAYLYGATLSGKIQKNKIFRSSASGDGAVEYDVFPNDASYVVDVEFNDGDSIKALGSAIDRIVVLKNRSVVLLTPTADGGMLRDLVSTGKGIISDRTLVKIGEQLYWLASDGFYRFSTSGLEPISEGIRPTLDIFTDTQKSSAFSWVDSKELEYYTQINATTLVFNTVSGEWREWRQNTTAFNDACLDSNDDASSRPVNRFLAEYNGTIYRPDPTSTSGVGGSVYFSFKTSELRPQGAGAFDIILRGISCEETLGSMYATIYNEEDVEVDEVILEKNEVRNLKPGLKVKSFSVELWGYLSSRSPAPEIRQLHVFYDIVPAIGLNKETTVPGS